MTARERATEWFLLNLHGKLARLKSPTDNDAVDAYLAGWNARGAEDAAIVGRKPYGTMTVNQDMSFKSAHWDSEAFEMIVRDIRKLDEAPREAAAREG